jgi:cyanophycinase
VEKYFAARCRRLGTTLLLATVVTFLPGSSIAATAQTDASASEPSYRYVRVGNPNDRQTTPLQGAALMGGGNDQDPAFRWLCDRARGGDFLILTAANDDEYNSYIQNLCHVNSVATLILPSRAAAEAPFVADTIRHAEAIFITGGDQSNYIKYWQGTPVQASINERLRDGVPIGGTSAGLAVLGEFVFTALYDTALSSETLADPYNKQVTLGAGFLDVPYMQDILTDQHFVKRNRLGRSVGFLARILQDGMAASIREIAVDERNVVLVDEHGNATLVGKGAAYFLRPTAKPEVCQPGKPLTFRNIEVYKITRRGTFAIKEWVGSGGVSYTLSAVDGKLQSSIGTNY